MPEKTPPSEPVVLHKRPPVVLQWYAGGAYGALVDAELNFHSGRELLGWAAHGIDFVVLDAETGEDVTRLFLAHWDEGRVVDPLAPRVSA